MPSEHHNLAITKAMHLMFFTVRLHFGPRGAFWHTVCTIHSSWTYSTSALLCVPFIFADSEKCRFSGCT